MECQHRAKSLVVLTLLQLCRAEIKDAQPQWYSANIINDGFQPKSISELFPSEAPFSTSNPIIVASKTSNSLSDDILSDMLSTLTPPTSMSTTSSAFGSPASSQSQSSSFSSQPSLSPMRQYTPNNKNQQSFQQINQPSVQFHQQPSQADFEPMQPKLRMLSELQSQTQRNAIIQSEQSTSTETLTSSPPVIKLTTFYQPPAAETTLSRRTRYDFPQDIEISRGPRSSTPRPLQTFPPQSNYFLIYQQAPQSIQSYPDPNSSPRTTNGESSTSSPLVTSTFSPTSSSPSPTFSTIGSVPVRTTPLYYSKTGSPVTQQLSSTTSPKVSVTSLSTFGSSSMDRSTSATRLVTCMLPKSTTPIPQLIPKNPIPIPLDGMFPLKIRVVAPSGSITNVNFNPTMRTPISTQKYIAYTTRKPTSRRTPRPRKNTYERCLHGCRKNGQILCAAPLSQFPVDPKMLRGFPSVCHMACHNSYRKDPFEKVIDGSCGKLRTRIRPIDTDSKLKRDELHKLQYTLDNSGPHAIFEFSGAYS